MPCAPSWAIFALNASVASRASAFCFLFTLACALYSSSALCLFSSVFCFSSSLAFCLASSSALCFSSSAFLCASCSAALFIILLCLRHDCSLTFTIWTSIESSICSRRSGDATRFQSMPEASLPMLPPMLLEDMVGV